MKYILTLLHIVAALGFVGCSKEQKVESIEDPIYYLILGNVSDNFDSVELNQPSFGGAGAVWHEANGKKEGNISVDITGDRFSYSTQGENVSTGMPIHQLAERIELRTKLPTLYVYVNKHINPPESKEYRVECLYKHKIESDGSEQKLLIELDKIRANQAR